MPAGVWQAALERRRAADRAPHGRPRHDGMMRLDTLLGRGALTEVWRATTAAGEAVAVKRLRADRIAQRGAAGLIRREHDLLVRLHHPGIVAARGLTDGDEPALVMEYLVGGDLLSLAGFAPRHWIEPARDVLLAIAHVHENGFAHRDVKARNVLLDERERARLVDFGSATPLGSPATRAGTTAAHARDAADGVVTPDDDLYAFAVLLYELQHGRLPFGPRPASGGVAPGAPPSLGSRPGAPETRLEALVLEALAPPPLRHIGSIAAFWDVIESVIGARTSEAE